MTEGSGGSTLPPAAEPGGQREGKTQRQGASGAAPGTGLPANTGGESWMPPPPPAQQGREGGLQRLVKKLDPLVERTMIDMAACKDIVTRLVSAQKADLRKKVMESAPLEEIKPLQPIEKYRPAAPCASKWESMSGTDRYRLCGHCQSFLYDFTSMSLPEAEQLVYQRENRKNVVFYRRKDGKFLTQNCPIGLAQARNRFLLAAGSVIFLVVGAALLCLVPHPQPTVTSAPAEEAKTAGSKEAAKNDQAGQATTILPGVAVPGGGAPGVTPEQVPVPGAGPLGTSQYQPPTAGYPVTPEAYPGAPGQYQPAGGYPGQAVQGPGAAGQYPPQAGYPGAAGQYPPQPGYPGAPGQYQGQPGYPGAAVQYPAQAPFGTGQPASAPQQYPPGALPGQVPVQPGSTPYPAAPQPAPTTGTGSTAAENPTAPPGGDSSSPSGNPYVKNYR